MLILLTDKDGTEFAVNVDRITNIENDEDGGSSLVFGTLPNGGPITRRDVKETPREIVEISRYAGR